MRVVNTGNCCHRLRNSRTANNIRVLTKLAAHNALSNSDTFIDASYPDQGQIQEKISDLLASAIVLTDWAGKSATGTKGNVVALTDWAGKSAAGAKGNVVALTDWAGKSAAGTKGNVIALTDW